MDHKARLFLFNTEISLREFESNLLIALEAARRGDYSIIFDQRDLPILVRRAFPRGAVLHTKSLHPEPSMMHTLEKANKKGLKITSIDQEHGLLEETYDVMLEERYSDRALEIASAVFTWGEWDHTALLARFPSQAAKIIQGGAARVDSWRPEFAGLAHSAQQIVTGPYVLISSNLAINSHYHLREILEGMRRNTIGTPWVDSVRSMTKIMAHSAEMLGAYCDLLDALCASFPEITFVVRPHPTEHVDGWKAAAPNQPNLRIIREGSLTGWIHGAVAVIHNGCTSAFEASVAGKTVISYVPDGITAKGSINPADKLGYSAIKPSEVVSILQDCLQPWNDDSSNQATQQPDWLVKRIDFRQSRYNFEVVVDEWGSLGKHFTRTVRWRVIVLTGLLAWFGHFRRSLRLAIKREHYSLNKFELMRTKDVEDIATRMSEVIGLKRVPQIHRLGPRAWLVAPSETVD